MGEKIVDDCSSVNVALRIRPANAREKIDMCQVCTSVTPGQPQVQLGKDKAFTFDHVFDTDSNQGDIFNSCARSLIEGCLDGYNATIVAYGQTGSGKTYTMGTGFDVDISPHNIGIIPRAVAHLFNGISERRQKAADLNITPPEFKVTAQFMELYNEEIIDLLDTTKDPSDRGRKSHIKIHEDAGGGIYTYGTTISPVASLDDTIECLKIGSLSRTTASTNMNAQSSRSHAIFTLEVRQLRVVSYENQDESGNNSQESEFETLKAKFHFVDLAGSERLKRTGATGDRAKEGISINCGLLALGNVISALGDKLKKGCHVPYRDSKLTRLLQDSLGGNSRTVMIACISPCDRDFMETLNSLKYANRARNIQNKVVVNQDKTSRQIAALKVEIQELKEELLEYKQGKRSVGDDGMLGVNDMVQENTLLNTESNNLRTRIKSMQEAIDSLTQKNATLLAERATMNFRNISGDADDEIAKLIEGYIKEIEELRTKLLESELLCEQLGKTTLRSPRTPSRLSVSPMSNSRSPSGGFLSNDILVNENVDVNKLIDAAKKEVKMERRALSRQSSKTKSKEDEADDNEKDVNEAEEAEKEENDEGSQGDNEDGDSDEGENDDGEFNDLDDDGDDDEEDTSSEVESDENDHIHEDLAELTCEISIKQQLIDKLERSQKELHTMKHQYEHKLQQLQDKIRATETERDQVLGNLGKIEQSTEGKAKNIRDQYQKKLNDMQLEVKKLHAAKKEHAKLLRNNSQFERQLGVLQRELSDMKCTKVKLMNQIRAETKRNKESEARKNKEVIQLRKQQRLKDNQIRSLEAVQKQKEVVLKRKQEEVQSLRRRNQRPMSSKAAGRVGKYEAQPVDRSKDTKSRMQLYNRKYALKASKQKWDSLEKCVTKIITRKQTVTMMEKDMNVRLKEREKLSKRYERLGTKRKEAICEGRDEAFMKELDYEVNKTKGHLERLQDDIHECQSNIMELMEIKDDEPLSLVDKCSHEESRYLLEHLLALVVNKGLLAVQKEVESKELALKLGKVQRKNSFHASLLQYVLNESNPDIEIEDELLAENDQDDDSDSESAESSSSQYDSIMDQFLPDTTSTPSASSRKNKARRKTATPEELLYPMSLDDVQPNLASVQPNLASVQPNLASVQPNLASVQEESLSPEKTLPVITVNADSLPDVVLMPPPKSLPLKLQTKSVDNVNNRPEPSPVFRRKTFKQTTPDPSPTFGRKNYVRQNSAESSSENVAPSPPGSPTRERRNTSDNVFSRLTNQTQNHALSARGTIRSMKVPIGSRSCPLVCTHKVEGHSQAVLSVFATDKLLFTGGKDQLAKVWDLKAGQIVSTLSGHPNNVSCIRYSEEDRMIFSVSHYLIKVWDQRTSKCVKSLCSSGQVIGSSVTTSTSSSRQVRLPPCELVINDVAPCRGGRMLFTAAGNQVRLWDLRQFSPVGKLSGGHQAAVMVLAVEDSSPEVTVVTGAKDHYIKVFQVNEGATGVLTPTANLEPPHYDGIQSLAIQGSTLFSGSRDSCIKKWDLDSQQMKHSINAAHKDWVCGLAFMPDSNCLLSGCRGGILKLWSVGSCNTMCEIRAHNSPINALTTNSTCVFTASNDSTVGIWQRRGSEYDGWLNDNSDDKRYNSL